MKTDPLPSRREALEELYSLCCQWNAGGEDRFPVGIKKQLEVVRQAAYIKRCPSCYGILERNV